MSYPLTRLPARSSLADPLLVMVVTVIINRRRGLATASDFGATRATLLHARFGNNDTSV